VQVQIAKIYNGQKYGPIFRTWTLANGKLHGTIYYNTYDSPLAQQTGAMMRIKGNERRARGAASATAPCATASRLGRVDGGRGEPQRARRHLRPHGRPA
jgi:hypothetical protein